MHLAEILKNLKKSGAKVLYCGILCVEILNTGGVLPRTVLESTMFSPLFFSSLILQRLIGDRPFSFSQIGHAFQALRALGTASCRARGPFKQGEPLFAEFERTSLVGRKKKAVGGGGNKGLRWWGLFIIQLRNCINSELAVGYG